MKLKGLFYFSMDRLLNHRGYEIMLILLLSSSFFTVGLITTDKAVVSYEWNECNTVLKNGINETGLIRIIQYNKDEGAALMEKAWQTGLFNSIGGFTDKMGVNDRLHVLWERQKLLKNKDLDSQYLWWINIDEHSMELCNFDYEQMESISDEKRNDKNWYGIILGGNYKDIPVGTIFYEEVIPGSIWKYEVVGVIKKNTRMISSSVLTFGKGSNFQSSILLDDYILRIQTKEPLTSSWAYTMNEGVALNEGKKILMNIAEEMDIDIRFANLSTGFEMDTSDQNIINNILSEILFLVLITTFFINLFVFLLTYFNSIEEIGVFYANGFSMKDMVLIHMLENLIRFFVSIMISCFVLYIYMKYQAGSTMVMQQGIRHILWETTFPFMVVTLVCFYFLFCIIPIIIISNNSPVSLLRKMKG